MVKHKESSEDNNTSDSVSGLGITFLVTAKCRQLQSMFINKSLLCFQNPKHFKGISNEKQVKKKANERPCN